jgi:hypothetical protein
MNLVTHIGTISDIAHILPICSWLYETTGDKVIFMFPKQTEKIESILNLIKIQRFTQDVILIDFNYSDGYKFDPKKYKSDLSIKQFFNFNQPLAYVEDPTIFQAKSQSLGFDPNYTLNLGLEFKYSADKISITKDLLDVYPNYNIIESNDLLNDLRDLAYSKERHLGFNNVSVYFSLTKIPFYLYMFKKEHGFYLNETIENFWLYMRKGSILDIRDFDVQRKIISVYDKIYFR